MLNAERRSIVIGTAGHIDHGKSALVKALTGSDPDRLKEEKARGITIDLGFAHAEVGGIDVAFVDVPGHERFVKNMLAGVGGIDAVLLVIAADESVMPQTREHFAICRLLGVRSGLIVLTKSDLVDAETLEIVRMDARELVAGSALGEAPIVAVSSKTGEGLDALRAALTGIAGAVPGRSEEGVTRLPIDRVFSMRGFGTVVTGTLTSGTIRSDEELLVLPLERRVKVRGVQVHGQAQASAGAGRRVALNLGGVEVADLHRGDTLTRAGGFDATRRFDVAIDLLPDAKPLRHGARIRFHHGTSEILGRVALAGPIAADAGTESWSDGSRTPGDGLAALQPGRRGFARIRLEAPAVLTRGDRFILRAYSPATTIGGGSVLDPLPARTPIRSAAAAVRFRRLDGPVREAAMAFVDERGVSGVTVAALARRAGLSPTFAFALATELEDAGELCRFGEDLFGARLVAALEERLVAAVADHHRLHPIAEGLPREEARERLLATAAPGLFDRIVQRLTAATRLSGRDRLALPGRGVSLTDEETHAQDALARVYREAGLAPPDLPAAGAAAGVGAPVADRIARLLVRQKILVKIDAMFFHAESLARLKQELAALKAGAPRTNLDVAGFKDRYGISRKYAIPLLEWLDRERVTRRVGDARVIL